jgi:hypothetical protein
VTRQAALLAVLLVAGCGPEPTVVPDPVVPGPVSIVGAWSRSGTNTEVAYRFLEDGRYRSVEILSYPEPDGAYQMQRVEDGIAAIAGDRLSLTGATALLSRTSDETPERNFTDRPTPTRTATYAWRIEGSRLVLVDADGEQSVLTRQP